MAALPQARLVLESPIYETEPWGDADQPYYANQVVALDLEPIWTPGRLLAAIQAIETDAGRIRDPKRRFGPRTLDVDILLFGQGALHEPDLLIPHPRLRQRAFVLVPLADIAAELTIPDGQGGSVRQALAKIPFKISGNVITAGT